MTKNSTTSAAVALAAAAAVIDPLDISVDPHSFTVADLRALLGRYPADAPVRISMFESDRKRATPEFFPVTRLVYGTIESPVTDDASDEESFVLMFDTSITGEEFDGPHDADRDHNAGIVAQAAKATSRKPRESKAAKAARETQIANSVNVVKLVRPTGPTIPRK